MAHLILQRYYTRTSEHSLGMNTVRSRLIKLFNVLSLYSQRHQQRKALTRLNEMQLKDIGLSASQAKKEASRYFWQ